MTDGCGCLTWLTQCKSMAWSADLCTSQTKILRILAATPPSIDLLSWKACDM
jgi:hypothetical protein